MSLVRRLRSGLTYANVMSGIALFVALSGGAYALSVPKHSVGSRQLRKGAVTTPNLHRGAVTSAKVRNHSLKKSDLARGVIPTPPVLRGARATDLDPPGTPGVALQSASLNLNAAGKGFVLATLRGAYLTCGTDACEADWGIYVDGKPVPQTGVRLQAAGADGDGHDFDTLFGLTPSLPAGSHTITLNMTSAGSPVAVGQLGAQLGAIASGA